MLGGRRKIIQRRGNFCRQDRKTNVIDFRISFFVTWILMCVKLGKVIGSDRIGFEVCLSWRAVCSTGRADENYPRSLLVGGLWARPHNSTRFSVGSALAGNN